MFNIDTFKSGFARNGYLQTNRFKVVIAVPDVMQGQMNINQNGAVNQGGIANLLTFRAEQVKAPGVTLLTNDTYRYGMGVRQAMPYNANYTDNVITFISDGYGDIWTFWYLWIRSIFGFAGNDNASGSSGALNSLPSYQLEYKDNYATQISITIYDVIGNDIQTINMYDAFPVSINDTQLAWGDNNNMLRITVGFTFKEFTIMGAGSNIVGAQPQPLQNPTTLFPATQNGSTPTG